MEYFYFDKPNAILSLELSSIKLFSWTGRAKTFAFFVRPLNLNRKVVSYPLSGSFQKHAFFIFEQTWIGKMVVPTIEKDLC